LAKFSATNGKEEGAKQYWAAGCLWRQGEEQYLAAYERAQKSGKGGRLARLSLGGILLRRW